MSFVLLYKNNMIFLKIMKKHKRYCSLNERMATLNESRHSFISNQTRLFVRPIHLGHANIALISLLNFISRVLLLPNF